MNQKDAQWQRILETLPNGTTALVTGWFRQLLKNDEKDFYFFLHFNAAPHKHKDIYNAVWRVRLKRHKLSATVKDTENVPHGWLPAKFMITFCNSFRSGDGFFVNQDFIIILQLCYILFNQTLRYILLTTIWQHDDFQCSIWINYLPLRGNWVISSWIVCSVRKSVPSYLFPG